MAEKQNKSVYQKVVNFLWRGFLVGLAFLIIYVVFVSVNFLFLFGSSPGSRKIRKPSTELASELYTSDGVLIGKYFTENRSPVTYQKISPMLIKALVATEDIRFYEHAGIDPKALGSVFYFTPRAINEAAVPLPNS